MELTEYVKKSWQVYQKFAVELIIAMIVAGIIMMIPAGIGFVALLVTGATNVTLGAIVAGLFGLLAAAVALPLVGGYLGICSEALKGKKPSIDSMLSIARTKYIDFIKATIVPVIVLGSLWLLSFLPVIGAFTGTGTVDPSMLSLAAGTGGLLGIVGFVAAIFFSMAVPAVVVDKMEGFAAIGKSIEIAKKEFVSILLLTLILGVVAVVLNFIPLIGALISLFVWYPVSALSIVLFYTDRK